MLSSISDLGGTQFASELLARSIRVPKKLKPGPNVLCIARPRFIKDVPELDQRTDMNLLLLRVGYLEGMLETWVSPEMRQQAYYYTQCERPEFAESRRQVNDLARRVIQKVRKRTPVDAILAAHIDYWQSDGFVNACAEMGIPFLVLCREAYVFPASYEHCLSFYRSFNFKYHGAGVAVFDATTRKGFIEAGACTPEQVWVTGAPRFDAWREVVLPPPEQRNAITMLSYSPVKAYGAPQNYEQVLKLFAQASVQWAGAGVRFVVKFKDLVDQNHAETILKEFPKHRLSLEIHTPLFELLPQSRLIVGYNSYSILEGLLGNAVLAVPYWQDTKLPSAELLIDPADPDVRKVFHFPESPAELEALIQQAVQAPPPQADRNLRMEVLQKYIYFPREKSSSALVEDFVKHFIAQTAAKRAPV